MSKVAIIGGGASGLLCAIFCAKKGLEVDVYEQNAKCAKKILVSGNGRCNITNTNLSSSNYFGEDPSFVNEALKIFSYNEFEKFALSIGLVLDAKDDGRVYPLSNEAKSVASLLIDSAQKLGVNFHTENKITDIKALKEKYHCVIIATGSEAASHLGGNNDGHNFAKEFGHSIIPTYASLVQLELNADEYKPMRGAKVDGEVSLFINNKKHSSVRGDILFTEYGISGFAILDISQEASYSLLNYQIVDITLNLLPKFNQQKLSAYIATSSSSSISLLNIIHGLLPLKIATNILNVLDFSHNKMDINTKEAKKIANKILNWKFEVSSTHGFRHGEVSGGGVSTTELNPKTMESLKEKNLYFCGEVIDIVGQRGGYNFAWSWASSFLCSKNISLKL